MHFHQNFQNRAQCFQRKINYDALQAYSKNENYKCNQPFTVGVIGGGFDERTALTVNTSDEWNKIYVQLTKVVSTPPAYASYKVFIHARKEVVSPQIYIDNVKLIYQ